MGRFSVRQIWKKPASRLARYELGKRPKVERRFGAMKKMASLVIVGVLGLVAYLNFGDASNNPRPLSSAQKLPFETAADADFINKLTTKIPENVLSQLAEDKSKERLGKAQNHKHIKQLAEGRSTHSRVFLNEDGTKSVEYSADATGYQDRDGAWKDVDASLVKDGVDRWITKANSWQVGFGPLDSDGVKLIKDGDSFQLSPVGANSAKPSVKGVAPSQTITYANVWSGVDLVYKVSGSQLKESIVLRNKQALSRYSFTYTGANLVAKQNVSGAYVLDGAFAGFELAAPTVSTHDKGLKTDASKVTQYVEGGVLKVVVDDAWLQSLEAKAFPVIIDPTVFNVSATTYKNFTNTGFTCLPGQGCGNSVGHDAFVDEYWRFAYQVTIPSSPGQYLVSAKLHLEMPAPDGNDYGVTTPKTISATHASCSTGFNCIDGSYGEASASIGTSGDIEMASLYRYAVEHSDPSPWMIVRGEETAADSYKYFDDTKTKVVFTYETLPAQSQIANGSPLDEGNTPTTQPIMKSTVPTDPDGPGPMLYRYIVGTSKSLPTNDPFHIKQGVFGVVADSGLLGLPQWAVPDSVLQDGNTYYWQPIVWDSYSGAPQVYGPVYSFKVDLRNGKDDTQAYDSAGPVNVDLATGNLTATDLSHTIKALGGDIGIGLDYNSPQRSRKGLIGQYWNDPSATRTIPVTAPAVTRADPNVAFSWGSGSPYTGVITSDNFLARWTGYFVAPQAGTYQFGATSDDRSRVYVNGSVVADGWSANPTNLYSMGITLAAGQIVPIKYEFAEWSGNASAQLLVKTTDNAITARPIPTDWLETGIRPIATPHGLVGRYYTDDGSHNFPANLADPTRIFLSRTDTSLSQNWGANSPVPNGPINNFMVKWTGFFTAPTNDTYTFGVGSDDGARVTVNGNNTVVNAWSDHGASPIVYGNSITLTAGQTIPITVDYYENTGNAEMSLYVRRASLGTADFVVDTNWLSPGAQVLPDGWSLGLDADGNLSYSFATINQNSVTLYDSQGQTHEYKFVNGGFTPPVNESGHLVRNGDGTVTLEDDDGRTYIFNSDGTIKSVTTPVDDRNPAALLYTYGSSNGSAARITQITDGVTSSRWIKILYSGDASCPAAPSGFLTTTPANMICAAVTSDNNVTKFFYTADSNGVSRLAHVESPGAEMTDYGYDAVNRIAQVRESLANDAVSAGVRAQDGTEVTQVTYDALGRVSGVTLPAATAGAVRLARTYEYLPNSTSQVHVVNATEPNGFTRKITYDGTYRTLTDTDIANLTTVTEWDNKKDLVLAKTDPAGFKTTNKYDHADRLVDAYGPAPVAWYGADNVPLTSPTNYLAQVPHSQKGYDEGIHGLATAYYNVDTASNGTGGNTKLLSGNPKGHATSLGNANGNVVKTWNGTPPITPGAGMGWGARLTGKVRLTTVGNYNFRVFSDDGVRLWVDDVLVIDDWNDGAQRSHVTGTFNNTSTPADSWHRIRLDYYNKSGDTDARLELYMTPPGGTETSALGTLLTPLYNLVTTEKTFDSNPSVGDRVTTNNYGTAPELRLLQSSSVDPTGLNYVTSYTYEAQGATGSFLRQTSKTLPGGVTTNYNYYSATDTRDDPCTANITEAYKQAGLIKIKTDPDPDGVGAQTSITNETIYDDMGRVVATRINSDPWKCTTYDARGRVTQLAIPALPNTAHVTRSARTIINNYSVGGNPLVSSVSDSSGTVTTTNDLLGRMVTYQDLIKRPPGMDGPSSSFSHTTNYAYDNIGRLITRSDGSTVTYIYDNLNRLSQQQYNGMAIALPTYDGSGRLQSVSYPAAGSLSLTLTRDNNGRVSAKDYVFTNRAAHVIDSASFSQSGMLLSGTEDGQSKTYTYDKAGRLTGAVLGSKSYTYDYSQPTACTGTYNPNAGKDSNITKKIVVNGSTTTTRTYCYNYADRLINSTAPNLSTVTYNSHGSMASGGSTFTVIEYDSSNRAAYLGDGNTASAYDVEDRMSADKSAANYYAYGDSSDSPIAVYGVTQVLARRFIQLPGGVTIKISAGSVAANHSSNIYNLPNLHGDIMATATGEGSLSDNVVYRYEPFGKLDSGNQIPNSSFGGWTYGWEGEHQISTNKISSNKYIFMGARLYIPEAGRFAQTDPVEGGNDNAYSYPADPVNDEDLDGNCAGRFISYCARAIPYIDRATNKAWLSIKSVSPFSGKEFNVNNNFRVKPFGHWRGNSWPERLPHYHKRHIDPTTGQTRPGGGISKHHPWDTIFKGLFK
jgi:RHS repeat-associated protein